MMRVNGAGLYWLHRKPPSRVLSQRQQYQLLTRIERIHADLQDVSTVQPCGTAFGCVFAKNGSLPGSGLGFTSLPPAGKNQELRLCDGQR
jgi:hypothetical protein